MRDELGEGPVHLAEGAGGGDGVGRHAALGHVTGLKEDLEREIERELVQVPWAPRVNVSARTGRHIDKLATALDEAIAGWETRVSTGRLNQFLNELVSAHPHPVRGGKQPRILFGAQVGVAPPTFALFTTGFLEAGYRRFIERRLREDFGFVGSPIRILMRVREKRRR